MGKPEYCLGREEEALERQKMLKQVRQAKLNANAHNQEKKLDGPERADGRADHDRDDDDDDDDDGAEEEKEK